MVQVIGRVTGQPDFASGKKKIGFKSGIFQAQSDWSEKF